ncbi:MAG: DJ-1/PfpI family protein [Rudaea sp.]|nr:DJ-1/PfpI family protein [Rudaea sp.]
MQRHSSPTPSIVRRAGQSHAVVMLGYANAQVLDITGPLEVFARASRWMRDNGMHRGDAYTVELAAEQAGPVVMSSGLQLFAARSYRSVKKADTLLIAGGIGCHQAMQDRALLQWLRRISTKVSRLGSVCTGSLILARAGLLENRSATTHWAYVRQLGEASSSILVQPDAIYVRDNNVFTSAGVTAGIDMALAMVEQDWGQPVALAVAQELVMFLKRPGGQSQFSSQLAAQFCEDDKLRELQLWILDNLRSDLSNATLAERVAMSERNFARRFAETLGVTPARYVATRRLEAARRKLEQGKLRISQIARKCGFGSEESLRRAFVAELGVSPQAYRERFHSAQ